MSTVPITSVWSSYGHRFMSTDCDEHEACLTCGAMFVLQDNGDGTGEYMAADGSMPQNCTRNTSMSHGYPGERESYEGDESHDCNCLFCDS